MNLIKVPSTLSDQQVLFLSDILCTAWHANELGEVKKGDVVAIWGAGPGEATAAGALHKRWQSLNIVLAGAGRIEHSFQSSTNKSWPFVCVTCCPAWLGMLHKFLIAQKHCHALQDL